MLRVLVEFVEVDAVLCEEVDGGGNVGVVLEIEGNGVIRKVKVRPSWRSLESATLARMDWYEVEEGRFWATWQANSVSREM